MKKSFSDWVDVVIGIMKATFVLCILTICITNVWAAKNCTTECSTLSCTTAQPGDCGNKSCASGSECTHCSCQKIDNGCDCKSK
jgi:hypothetical protein